MAELRRHVREVLGDDQALLVLDPSAFPKAGTELCGVDRQREVVSRWGVPLGGAGRPRDQRTDRR